MQAAFALLAVNIAILLVALWPMNKPTYVVVRSVFPHSLKPHRWDYGLIATFIYPGIYPLMKRVTYWPQAWLGMSTHQRSARIGAHPSFRRPRNERRHPDGVDRLLANSLG